MPFGATFNSSSCPNILLRKPLGCGFASPKYLTNSGSEMTARNGVELRRMLILPSAAKRETLNFRRFNCVKFVLPDCR